MPKEFPPQPLPPPLDPVVHIQRLIAVRREGDLNQAFPGAGAHGVQGGVAGGAGADAVDVGGVMGLYRAVGVDQALDAGPSGGPALAVLVFVRRRSELNIFGRTLAHAQVMKLWVLSLLALLCVGFCVFAITLTNRADFLDLLFDRAPCCNAPAGPLDRCCPILEAVTSAN